MKISLNWLKQYIHITHTPEELGDLLTQTGLEVEGLEPFEPIPGGLNGLVIGEVIECDPHPNADKLKVTKVDIGEDSLASIVCGAPNVSRGQKVVVGKVGTTLYPISGEPFKLKKAKIRGELSEGMICAEDEIGLGNNHDGIMVLETDLANGTPAARYFELESDYVYEIGLTPNRADATSHLGVARDIRAVVGAEVKIPSVESFTVDNHNYPIQVVVEDTRGCPRYSGVVVGGITVKESPGWLKNRLRSIGLTPINNVVDVTNYVLHELGQPLHAFDADQIEGNKVVVRTLAAGSKFVTLDEKTRSLTDHDLMICNAEEGMCIAGVFGGVKSGVTEKTNNVFLESAYFSPDYIRKTAQHHGLKTDASFRFERGTDPNMTVHALKRAATLIKEVAGGSISSEIVDVYPKPVENFQVEVKFGHVDRLVGQPIPQDRIWEILQRLDIQVLQRSEDSFLASVPPYRVDVQREADVIEEILRIYGYNQIDVGTALNSSYLAKFPKIDEDQLQYELSSFLAANGFNEIVTNSLTRPVYADTSQSSSISILNRLSEDLGVLRQSLVHSGLEVLAHNIKRKQTDVKIFEFGKVYLAIGKDQNTLESYSERRRLGLFMTGKNIGENWIEKPRPVQFSDLAGMVRRVLNQFGMEKVESGSQFSSFLESGVNLIVDGYSVGETGRIKGYFLNAFDIEQEVYYADLDWDYLLSCKSDDKQFKPIPKYPEVKRDLSLVLAKGVRFEQVERIIDRPEFGLIKEVSVFDVFEGKNIGQDNKAYALSFILQDEAKTLNDKAIERTMSRLMQSFENELGAHIRK